MSCICKQSNNISACPLSITIGTITNLLADVKVYVKNITTGKIILFLATSDVNGLVVIDTEDYIFNPGHLYEVEVVLASSANKGNNLLLTLDGFEVCCVSFRVDVVFGQDRDDEVLSFVNCASTETPPDSIIRYHQTAIDYAWPPNIWVLDITDTTNVITVTLGNPADYELGMDYTVSDISGAASLNNPIIVGDWLDGSASQPITSDLGTLVFNTTGTKFKIKGVN